MTIDEAIKHEKWEEKYAHIDEDASEVVISIRREYHKQLAEWLEELKEYRENIGILIGKEKGKVYRQGRKDAIEEFRNKLYERLFDDGLWNCVTEDDIEKLAEQMKEGRRNVD